MRHASQPEDRKRALRSQMLDLRGQLPLEEAARRSEAAQGHLLASPFWRNARTVALYMPIRREADTGLLCARAGIEGKSVLLPRCAAGRELELVVCNDAAQLGPGSYGILEPLPSLPAVDLEDPAQVPQLLIAPCLAVDRRAHRLGYGGGYYDRLLSRPALQTILCVALVYAMQIVDSLPVEDWDRRLHGVCSEEGFLWA